MSDDLTAWVTDTAPRALAYAVTLVRNETAAEDLVQDCYQRLLARSDVYDLPNDGAKLLFKAITNACINWTQRQPPVVSLESVGEQGDDAGEPMQAAMFSELSQAVDAALAELPVQQRAAIELHALGHTSTELAEFLETSSGNVRVLLHRARQQLSLQLKPFLEDRTSL